MIIFLLLLVLLKSSCSDLNSTSLGVGKCDSLFRDFFIHLEYDQDDGNNTVNCKKISDCFGSLKSENALKLKRIYDFRCVKYEFYNYYLSNVYQIMLTIYYSYYPTSSHCLKNYDFTARNLTVRRTALLAAEPCVIDTVKQGFHPKTKDFINTNYTKFVDYLTVPYGNESCDSIYFELERRHVLDLKRRASSDWEKYKLYLHSNWHLPDVSENIELCNKLKFFAADTCNIYTTSRLMRNCEIYNMANSSFAKCLRKDSESIHPIKVGFCDAYDKQCIENTMKKNCGAEGVSEFDKYYNMFNKFDFLKPNKIKVEGDFSKYVASLPKSEISGDSDVGKCAPLIDELVSLLSHKTSYELKKRSLISHRKCKQIMKCYGTINSKEAEDLKNSYKETICSRLGSISNLMGTG